LAPKRDFFVVYTKTFYRTHHATMISTY